MSNLDGTRKPSPLGLEAVSRAAAELAEEPALDRALARFVVRVREWAAPSAVLGAVRDPSADGGWRLLPALCYGSGPLGAERALPRLIDETPGCLERPTLVHPEPAPGVQPRANCILPWTHEGESGVLVVRGIPRPVPENLGEALAVLAAPVWPRLLGSPASRVESLVVELGRAAERLEADTARQIERLRAAHPPERKGPATDEADLGGKLASALTAAERATAERDEVLNRLRGLESAISDAERVSDEARAASEKAETGRREAEERSRLAEEALRAAQAELEAARTEGEHSTLEWDELRGRVATLQEAHQEMELERERVRDESERLVARIESMQSEHAAALERTEEQRRNATEAARSAEEGLSAAKKELESSRREIEHVAAAGDELKGRIVVLEEALQRAQSDRDEARAALERLAGERQAASDSARDLDESLVSAQRELELARQERQRATAEAGEMRARVGSLETTLRQIEAERDEARDRAELLEDQKRQAEANAKSAEEALVGVRQELAAARTQEGSPSAEAAPGEGAGKALSALRGTLQVLRRTPFVPPGLRVSMEEGAAALDESGEAPERWFRVALLDRDAGSLAPLADALEEAGVDVRVANYPEELALLMKTPDAQKLNAVVCDILAFRPDQTVAGLFRAWEKDRPGLALLLSFNPEDSAEAERAKRVPISLTSGRVPRPIPSAELIEKLRVLAQKQAASEA